MDALTCRERIRAVVTHMLFVCRCRYCRGQGGEDCASRRMRIISPAPHRSTEIFVVTEDGDIERRPVPTPEPMQEDLLRGAVVGIMRGEDGWKR